MKTPKIQRTDNLDNLREVSSYTHDEDKRPNNPRVGLASHDDQADKIHTYAFDVHSSPTLDWAEKQRIHRLMSQHHQYIFMRL